jgi:hypothetical protein
MRDPSSEYASTLHGSATPLTFPIKAVRLTWPAQQAPLRHTAFRTDPEQLSGCCDGPVEISNGCFQYCQTGLDMISFAECVRVTVAIDPHFITTCNKAAAETPADDDDVDAELVHNLARSNGWLSYMWRRPRRVLKPEHDGL